MNSKYRFQYLNEEEFKHIYREVWKRGIYNIPLERSNPRILDVGAHIGIATIYFKDLYPDADIIAFEPNPKLFKLLKTNLEQNGFEDVDVVNNAISYKEGERELYKEVSGSKIAFIGYNYYDTMLGTGAIATSTHAGANSYSESKMEGDIKEARENADVVIVDFQFQECYSYPEHGGLYPVCYRPLVSPDQKGTFRKAVEFGADIVLGTQAHQPQTYELYEDGVIFYGLGNLFFDQIPWIGTRHGMVLTHYFYNGNHIQTKITTTNYNSDMKTYVSEGEERELLLEQLLEARP